MTVRTNNAPVMKSYFPHKTYHASQEQVLDIMQANYNDYEYFILEAPPGVGKTAIADAFISYHKHGEALTKQIRLQNQYITGYGFVKVEGRRNFNCLVDPLPCSRGACLSVAPDVDICLGCQTVNTCEKTDSQREACELQRDINNEISKAFKCENKPYPAGSKEDMPQELFAATSHRRGDLYWKKLHGNCEYWTQKMTALNSPKVVHNYAYYLYESNYAGDFGSPEALVCDEAHAIEQTLMDFVSVSISERELNKIGVTGPNFADVDSWVTWLESLHQQFIPARIVELNNYFEITKKPDHRKKAELTNLGHLQEKLTYFFKKYKTNKGIWLFLPYLNEERKFEKVEFKPIIIDQFSQDKLFQNSKKKLLMSGTILDFNTFMRSLGIANKKCLIIQVPSPFPVENRPIYKADVARLDAKSIKPYNEDNVLGDLMRFIEETAENPHFRHSKGIIHCTTYKMANYIKENCSCSPRMLFHTDSEGANDILRIHEETSEPTILVSPSMVEGISLNDDLARWQIPLRVPFPNIGEPVIKARANFDKEWYLYMTACTLFQSIGRIVRHDKDYGITIIPDSRISYFLEKQFGWNKVPDWIKAALKEPEDLEKDYNLSYDFSGTQT